MSMNCFLITDLSWDNENTIKRRLCKLDKDIKIHSPYSNNIQTIAKVCDQNLLNLYRRSIIDNKNKESIMKILEVVDFCMIFHNFIEYNTITNYTIELCKKNSIPYFIFSEHTTEYFYNEEFVTTESFKKKSNKFTKIKNIRIIKDLDFDYEINNVVNKAPNSITAVIEDLRSKHKELEDKKNNKSIVLLYDKTAKKGRKEEHKTMKDIAYLDYMNNKMRYIKSIDNRK